MDSSLGGSRPASLSVAEASPSEDYCRVHAPPHNFDSGPASEFDYLVLLALRKLLSELESCATVHETPVQTNTASVDEVASPSVEAEMLEANVEQTPARRQSRVENPPGFQGSTSTTHVGEIANEHTTYTSKTRQVHRRRTSKERSELPKQLPRKLPRFASESADSLLTQPAGDVFSHPSPLSPTAQLQHGSSPSNTFQIEKREVRDSRDSVHLMDLAVSSAECQESPRIHRSYTDLQSHRQVEPNKSVTRVADRPRARSDATDTVTRVPRPVSRRQKRGSSRFSFSSLFGTLKKSEGDERTQTPEHKARDGSGRARSRSFDGSADNNSSATPVRKVRHHSLITGSIRAVTQRKSSTGWMNGRNVGESLSSDRAQPNFTSISDLKRAEQLAEDDSVLLLRLDIKSRTCLENRRQALSHQLSGSRPLPGKSLESQLAADLWELRCDELAAIDRAIAALDR